ncbi:MAG: hypothetical protein HY741_25870 [Chloroflexi bacterium]|nr:hypothetical protein [Chloroflexota bacterium]
MSDKTFLLLGGAGLVGLQVARAVAREIVPQRVIIASLYQREVREALSVLKKECAEVEWLGVWGDVFVRADFQHERRSDLLASKAHRDDLYDDLLGDLDAAYKRSRLVQLIQEYKPDVIVDSINTATAISYQDAYTAAVIAKQKMDALFGEIEALTRTIHQMQAPVVAPIHAGEGNEGNEGEIEREREREREREGNGGGIPAAGSEGIGDKRFAIRDTRTEGIQAAYSREQVEHLSAQVNAQLAKLAELRKPAQRAFEALLISQAVPQLVRHVVLILRAMDEVGTRLYLKIGTTGTGGMGLNIPYTHGEDKPSAKLMSKTAVGFAHTGLLFLMARTPNAPIVKEIKPAAMIGYADINMRAIQERGKPVLRYAPKTQKLNGTLVLRENADDYAERGKLEVVIVDTGENGMFAKGEFEAITAMNQMEFVTPEEIASKVVLEIRGVNTGNEVLSALDSTVLNPSYRAGTLRRAALEDLTRLENETHIPSVALGQLGPPELSKLLFEAFLLRQRYHTLERVLNQRPKKIADALYTWLKKHPQIVELIISVGLPILAPDGETLLRGPFLRIPERADTNLVKPTPEDIDAWGRKGWVDLRPENFVLWRERFEQMERAREGLRGRGSSAVTTEAYLFEEIRIGEVVAWVFNNEEEGYRIK